MGRFHDRNAGRYPAGMDRKSFDDQLRRDLAALEQHSRRRALETAPRSDRYIPVAGRPLLNLAGNDYLALNQHPHLKAAAAAAIEAAGVGAGASRLITGSLDRHAALEQRFAAFKHAEAALLLPTGYMANLAAITAIAGPGDRICLDKLNHASLIDAARLSGAEVRIFPHRGYEKLERLLRRRNPTPDTRHPGSDTRNPIHETRHTEPDTRNPRTLILTDAVFSMDGDVADLPRLCDLADAHDAVLIVDEAHGTGVLGETGAGLCEAQGVTERVDVIVSTASKALGSLGGLVTGSQPLIDTLVNHARSAIYTTAAPPAQAAAIDAALDVLAAEPERRQRLSALSHWVRGELAAMGWDPGSGLGDRGSAARADVHGTRFTVHSSQFAVPSSGATAPETGNEETETWNLKPETLTTRHSASDTEHPPSDIKHQTSNIKHSPPPTPIIPLRVGDPDRALALAAHLRAHGLLAAPIRYPTVPPGGDRVRLSLRADLTDDDVQSLLNALRGFEK